MFLVLRDCRARPTAINDATAPTPSTALLEYFDATITSAFGVGAGVGLGLGGVVGTGVGDGVGGTVVGAGVGLRLQLV